MKRFSIAYILLKDWDSREDEVPVIMEYFDSMDEARSGALSLVEETVTMELGRNGVEIETLWDERYK